MVDATERGGALASVYRMIKKKDGTTAVRITKDQAMAEANKIASTRSSGSPRNNKQAKQQAGSKPKSSK